jgi:hypothetical protein
VDALINRSEEGIESKDSSSKNNAKSKALRQELRAKGLVGGTARHVRISVGQTPHLWKDEIELSEV